MQNGTTSPLVSLSVSIMVRLVARNKLQLVTTAAALLGPAVESTSDLDLWTSSFRASHYGNGDVADGFSTLIVTSDSVISVDDTTVLPPSPTNVTEDGGYERSAVVHALWVSIIVLGVMGNGLVIYTMGRHGEKSATNVYILNLALSDFAVLTIVVPFTITSYTSFDWAYGETMCRATVYLIYVTLQATCLTLTAMTIDRYFAIVHPITSLRDRTPRGAVLISIATWLASSFVCVPFIVYSNLKYEPEPSGLRVYCVTRWPSDTLQKVVTMAFVMSTYVIPLAVIIVSYTLILRHLWRNKTGFRREMAAPGFPEAGVVNLGPVTRRRRKVAKMVFAVVLIFAVTWLPIHVFNLCFILIHPFPRTAVLYNVKIFCHTLSYLNSCLNPFVYAFLGDGFRRAFRKSFPRCTQRNQIVPGVQNDDPGPSTTAETRLAGSSTRGRTRSAFDSSSTMPSQQPEDN